MIYNYTFEYECPACGDNVTVTEEMRKKEETRCVHCNTLLSINTDADDNKDATTLDVKEQHEEW